MARGEEVVERMAESAAGQSSVRLCRIVAAFLILRARLIHG